MLVGHHPFSISEHILIVPYDASDYPCANKIIGSIVMHLLPIGDLRWSLARERKLARTAKAPTLFTRQKIILSYIVIENIEYNELYIFIMFTLVVYLLIEYCVYSTAIIIKMVLQLLG